MLYHLSKVPNLTRLDPKIPSNALKEFEDTITERVCFSDNIYGCLSALQDIPSKYYVYVPNEKLKKKDVYKPTADDVLDCKLTHEIWVKRSLKVRCIGIIQSENHEYSIKEVIDENRSATYFHYPYKWIEKYEE